MKYAICSLLFLTFSIVRKSIKKKDIAKNDSINNIKNNFILNVIVNIFE